MDARGGPEAACSPTLSSSNTAAGARCPPRPENTAADDRAFLAFVDKAISHLKSGLHCGPTWAWTVEQVLKSCRAYASGLPEDELLIGLLVSWSEALRCDKAKTKLGLEGPVHDKNRLRNMSGAIDFSRYPIRTYVNDLCDGAVGASLFGTVRNVSKVSASGTTFCLDIEDVTGVAKLNLSGDWPLGRVGIGHMVYISGVTCTLIDEMNAEFRWRANDSGSLFFNLSLLRALLNSKYLHDVSPVSDLPSSENRTHICRVAFVSIRNVKVSLSHVLCGVAVNEQPDGLYCPFCEVTCQKRCLYSFRFGCLIIDKGNVPWYVWCDGPAAEEVLQISPARYMTLQEEQRQLHLKSLKKERFMVALAYNPSYPSWQPMLEGTANKGPNFVITAAQKCK